MIHLTEPLLQESRQEPNKTSRESTKSNLTRSRQFLPNQSVRFYPSPKSASVILNYAQPSDRGFSLINDRSKSCDSRTLGIPPNDLHHEELCDHDNQKVDGMHSNHGNDFLIECDLQLNTLFAFIQTSVESIQCQLDKRSDWLFVSMESHVREHPITTPIAPSFQSKASLTREDLRENVLFCDRALEQVRQLKSCMMVNLSQLHNIIECYNQAYPEENDLIARLMVTKHDTVYELTEKLEQCLVDVKTRKEYLEARLTVVGWKDLMKPQYKQLTLFAFAHFIVFLLAIAALAWFAGYRDRYIGLFYLYRGPMFISLYFYFYSFNLVGWATANIRYIDIFGFSSAQETPTPYVIFNIAGILSLTFTVFVSALIFTVQLENSEIPERILPIILWMITAIVLINPLKWLLRKGRWGIFKITFRILLAPFYPVTFGDFWFADQLNSIIIIFLDFEFMLCFYFYVWPLNKNEDGAVCNGNSYIIRPVVSCLPAFWRLMQCLRCYYDTRRYQYLINAGKYFTTFPVVILFSLFAIDRQSLTDSLHFKSEGALLILWVVCSLINALYTFLWDVYMDWGLFQSRDLLRSKLSYRWKALYYLAIFENLILRFAWSFKISLGLQLQAQVNLMYTLLAGLEIFRRFVWNFFRIEFEHVRIMSQLKENNKGVLYMDTVL